MNFYGVPLTDLMFKKRNYSPYYSDPIESDDGSPVLTGIRQEVKVMYVTIESYELKVLFDTNDYISRLLN